MGANTGRSFSRMRRARTVWSWGSFDGTVLVATVRPCAFVASSQGMRPHGEVRAPAMTVRAVVAWYAALARPAALPETHLSKGGSRMAGNTRGRSIPSLETADSAHCPPAAGQAALGPLKGIFPAQWPGWRVRERP
jgi:hypothetical protein